MYTLSAKSSGRVVQLTLLRKLSAREYAEICSRLRETIQTWNFVDLLCEIDAPFRGTWPVLWKAALVASGNEVNLRRVAVVGDSKHYKWARVIVRGFHAETQYFPTVHRTRARTWLEKGAADFAPKSEQKLAGDAGYRVKQGDPPRHGRKERDRRSKRNGAE